MRLVFPIYGYHITKPISIRGGKIWPRTTDHWTAESWSRNLNTYHLTAALITEDVTHGFIFNLEAALSFIEQLDVIIGEATALVGEDPFPQLKNSFNRNYRNDGGGAMIGTDTFFPSLREKFLVMLLEKLDDQMFCKTTQFNQLFFKSVERFRQRKCFIEVAYFFVFSGLETFARAVLNDRLSKQAAVPITKLLINYGFDISIDRPTDFKRSLSTYAHLRNAVFHNSDLSVEVNINRNLVKFSLIDYLFNITQLTNLVVLKAIQFDDEHINWDSWVDRQPFK